MEKSVPQTSPVWLNIFVWVLLFVVLIIPFIAWGSLLGWKLNQIGVFDIFPLFGLWAFSIMWTHYVVAEIKLWNPSLVSPKIYNKVSFYIVLALILLHPGLLAYGQWSIGQGLPPGSWFAYVGETLKIPIIFGITAWIIFLSYEVIIRLKNRPEIIKILWLVNIFNTIAMSLIFYHALSLGTHLQGGFLYYVWLFYGISLFLIFIHLHKSDWDKYHLTKLKTKD